MDSGHSSQDDSVFRKFLFVHNSVRFIRLHWVDLSGVLRTRFITAKHCARLAAGNSSYGVGPACMEQTLAHANAIVFTQDLMELKPDWSSLMVCGQAPHHAAVMCYVCSESLKDPFSQCARHLLARTLVKARENGLSFLVGFEIEFVLLDSSGKSPTTLDNVEAWSTMGGLRGKNLVIMESIVGALEASGIAVFHFHTETPPQLELALEPLPPMQAVDSLMLAQETIRHVCIEHGYKATMITKPLLDNASVFSSVHTHLSITPSDSENCFLAGLLHSLRSICALGMASYDSYVRVKEGSETVGVWVSWGTQNRGVPIRKIGSGHWEIRTVDSTANFYLLLSAVIAAGVGGIESSLQLRLKDCRIFPSQMTPDDRLEVAIDTRLPLSLRESIEFLSQDASMKKWLGDILWNSYISTKKRDEAVFDEMMDEPRRQNMLKYF